MITVTRPYFPPLEEYVHFLQGVWESGQLTNNGPLVRRLEREIAERTGTKHALFMTNGTLALQIALRALDVTQEVITTPFSYVATTTSILWEHCTPVFVDIEDQTFCIDPSKVERAITPRTQAIMATHVYGNPCDVHALQQIADRRGLKIIYDGAHAFETFLGQRSLLSFGDCTALSFHATKLFHTIEGGALLTDDDELAKRASLLRSFGHVGDEYYSVGTNAKASEVHAAMGLCLLPKLPKIIDRRRAICGLYDSLLMDRPLRRRSEIPDFTFNYAYYPIVLSSEDVLLRVKATLEAADIGTRRYFYPSLNQLPYLQGAPCPVSEDIARRVLCLPLYDALTDEDVNRVCGVITRVL